MAQISRQDVADSLSTAGRLVQDSELQWRALASKRIDTRSTYDKLVINHSENELTSKLISIAAQKAESAARTAYYDAVTAYRGLLRIQQQATVMAASK